MAIEEHVGNGPSLRHAITAVLVAACAGCAAGGQRPGSTLDIAAVRQAPLGSAVDVTGTVTVPSGTFDAGFALQDASGGIHVVTSPAGQMRLGDRVRVGGSLEAPHAQLGIAPAAIERLGTAVPPSPKRVDTGAVGAATDGALVRVVGVVQGDVIRDPPWGWKLYVDDGSGPVQVFVSTPTGIDVGQAKAGARLAVVGFSGRYNGVCEVLPRSPGDVTAAQAP